MAEGQSNWKQDFFDRAPEIRLKDPLAYVLGAMGEDGALVFKYADVVKMAQVISLITGAAGETGFGGLGRKFGRKNNLVFDKDDLQYNTFIFRREDTGKAVKVTYNTQGLPQNPLMGALMPLVVNGQASKDEREQFVSLWQGNVRRVLLEPDKYPGLFAVEELKGN